MLPDRYPGTRLYDADCQDEIACFLLGQRGIDKYLAGRMSKDTLMLNLAKEWDSLPKPDGAGTYSGQRTGARPDQVRAVLAHVCRRHAEGSWWQKITGMFAASGFGGGLLWGANTGFYSVICNLVLQSIPYQAAPRWLRLAGHLLFLGRGFSLRR